MAKTKFVLLILLSLLSLILSIIFTIDDFLTIGNSYSFLCCYWFPYIFAILLGVFSLSFLHKFSSPVRFLPVGINITTVIVVSGLFIFNHYNPDMGFQYLFNDYSEAVNEIESGQLKADEDGFVRLPENISGVSITGYAFVTRTGDLTSIYFMYDRDTFDGYSWGYLYRSDGSQLPFSEKYLRLGCNKARQLVPPTPKWFYCEAHGLWVSSAERK